MNRYLVVFFSSVVLLGVTVAQDSPSPKTDEPTITAIQGTPKIDGKIDPAWKDAPRVDVNKAVAALLSMDGEKMATAKARFLWDVDHLYVLWQVKDAALSAQATDPWEQDSVEVFLDENRKRTAWYESDDAQYRVSYEGTLSGQGAGFDPSNLKAVARKTKNGYVVEMSIDIQGDKLESGRKLGVELQVNDDPGTGERGAVGKWNHTEDDSWENTSNFGTLLLK